MKTDFKPFDRVLVRNESGIWCCSLYSHKPAIDGHTLLNGDFSQECLPYEGNEHLLGTDDSLQEPELFEFGDHVEVRDTGHPWVKAIYLWKAGVAGYYRCAIEDGEISDWEQCRKADW